MIFLLKRNLFEVKCPISITLSITDRDFTEVVSKWIKNESGGLRKKCERWRTEFRLAKTNQAILYIVFEIFTNDQSDRPLYLGIEFQLKDMSRSIFGRHRAGLLDSKS